MKQCIYYLVLIYLFSYHDLLLAQLDQCKGLPPYFMKKGINPQKAYLSTSEKFLVGMALIESEQPGNPNAKIIKVIQDSTWTNKGYLGAICTDQSGNSYVLPSAKVNLLKNPLEKQNTVYKVDANTGLMNDFVQIPMDILPGAFNPFGLLGSFYDCSTSQLILSTVAGSSENREIGKVCKIDIRTKEIATIVDLKDIYGLALHIHQGRRMLYLSSARVSKLYSMELDDKNNPKGILKEEFSIAGLGPRGDDKIRKIRFTSDGKMQLNTILFYFNLTAPSEDQQSKMTFVFDIKTNVWKLYSIE